MEIPKNAIIINGIIYRAVKKNHVPGLSPDPCSLCDIGMKRKCMSPMGYANKQPCELFNHGHQLTHFKKV